MVVSRTYIEGIKKIAKFVWRHLFTLGNLAIGFSAFMEGPLHWKNGLYMTIAAAFLDWAKQFIKITPNANRSYFSSNGIISTNSSNNHWSDSYVVGSDSYLMRKSRDNY